MNNIELTPGNSLNEDTFKKIFSDFFNNKPITTKRRNLYLKKEGQLSELADTRPNFLQILDMANKEIGIDNEEDLLEKFENDTVFGPMFQVMMAEINFRDEQYNTPITCPKISEVKKQVLFGIIDGEKYTNSDALYHAVETILKGYIEFPDDIQVLDGDNLFEHDNRIYYEYDDSDISEREIKAKELANFLNREVLLLVNPNNLDMYVNVPPSLENQSLDNTKNTRDWTGHTLV